jgi:hypothetical protein
MWQGFDAIDLFMAHLNFHPENQAAASMMATAINQLTASARQLVACEVDSSLPQGMALACELAGKAVLLHSGYDDQGLREIGHSIPKLIERVRSTGSLSVSPVENQMDEVVPQIPHYTEVRYASPPMTIVTAQDLFRKAMFFVSELLRRTNHDQLYWKVLEDRSMVPRSLA